MAAQSTACPGEGTILTRSIAPFSTLKPDVSDAFRVLRKSAPHQLTGTPLVDHFSLPERGVESSRPAYCSRFRTGAGRAKSRAVTASARQFGRGPVARALSRPRCAPDRPSRPPASWTARASHLAYTPPARPVPPLRGPSALPAPTEARRRAWRPFFQ